MAAVVGLARALAAATLASVARWPAVLRAVIFDCDGVLFDSAAANVAYYDAIRARLGVPPMDADWRAKVQVLAAPAVLEAMFGHDPGLLAAARQAAHATSYEPFYALMEPAAGLADVLDTLGRRFRLAMATNRGSSVAGVVARFGLARWLHAAVGMLDVPRPKPAPDVIVLALERLGVPCEQAIYVGDAESDWVAADAAGVGFVAVGAVPGAPVQVAALSDLPAVLAGADH